MNTSELDETLRKIGRNVFNFQRIETILKYLVSHSSLNGTAESLKENHEKRIDSVSRKTMGNLVKELFTTIYADKKTEVSTTEEIKEALFNITVEIEADPAYVDQRKVAMERIVDERNILIHQSLSSFDPTSIESCRKFSVVLDEQAERVKSEFEAIRSVAIAMHEARKKAVEVLAKKISTSTK